MSSLNGHFVKASEVPDILLIKVVFDIMTNKNKCTNTGLKTNSGETERCHSRNLLTMQCVIIQSAHDYFF